MIGEYSTAIETAAPKVQYLTADHLGSPRITTDQFGQAASRRDFMPYGEEITAVGGRSLPTEVIDDLGVITVYPDGREEYEGPLEKR